MTHMGLAGVQYAVVVSIPAIGRIVFDPVIDPVAVRIDLIVHVGRRHIRRVDAMVIGLGADSRADDDVKALFCLIITPQAAPGRRLVLRT